MALGCFCQLAGATEIPRGVDGYSVHVAPFFKTHCIQCHGPEKSKGDLTLHTLAGDLSTGKDAEHWELVLEMLESGEMPPENESQPSEEDRAAVAEWIEAGLRDHVKPASRPRYRQRGD